MLETQVLLKAIYRAILKAESLDEAINEIRTMIPEEDAALVEKILEEEQAKKQAK